MGGGGERSGKTGELGVLAGREAMEAKKSPPALEFLTAFNFLFPK